MPTIFNDSTAVPLGFALTFVITLCGLIWQYAKLVARFGEQEEKLKAHGDVVYTSRQMVNRLEQEIEALRKEGSGLLDRMARMETKIDFIIESLKNK